MLEALLHVLLNILDLLIPSLEVIGLFPTVLSICYRWLLCSVLVGWVGGDSDIVDSDSGGISGIQQSTWILGPKLRQ